MQLADFLATYHPGLDGGYRITWSCTVDGFLHKLLANLAGMGPTTAYCIHVQEARVDVNRAILSDLRDPDGEVIVRFAYRVNQIPATFSARVPFYAGDIETLEPLHDLNPSSLSC